jgi:hypothetical protein
MFNRHVAVLAFGAVLAAVVGIAAQAPAPVLNAYTGVNNLTFAHAFTLPGVTMPAGTYVFESGPGNDPNIVRVSSKNRQKIFYEGFTTALAHPPGHSVVTFGEAAAGAPIPMLAWYPIGTKKAHGFQHQ